MKRLPHVKDFAYHVFTCSLTNHDYKVAYDQCETTLPQINAIADGKLPLQ